MAKVKGSRKFILDGKPIYAVPQDASGAKRWFYQREDVTDRLMHNINGVMIPAFSGKLVGESQGQAGAVAEQPAYADALARIGAALAAAGNEAEVQGNTVLETIEKRLQRMDSAVRVIKETVKGVEVGLRSISKQLHEADILHEIAMAEERKRAAERAPGPREHTRPTEGNSKGRH